MPVGTFTIERPITITRPKTVLRGAGRTKTTLYLPNSLAGAAGGRGVQHMHAPVAAVPRIFCRQAP